MITIVQVWWIHLYEFTSSTYS